MNNDGPICYVERDCSTCVEREETDSERVAVDTVARRSFYTIPPPLQSSPLYAHQRSIVVRVVVGLRPLPLGAPVCAVLQHWCPIVL